MKFKFSHLTILAFTVFSLLAPAAARAHHSFAMFDLDTTSEIVGKVIDFQWTNPHVWIQLSVRDEDGKEVNWSIEAGAPRVLAMAGWKRKTLRPGDEIKLMYHPLRSGASGGALVSVVLADGTVLKEGTDD